MVDRTCPTLALPTYFSIYSRHVSPFVIPTTAPFQSPSLRAFIVTHTSSDYTPCSCKTYGSRHVLARSHIESALSEAKASNNLEAYEHLSRALDALDRSASSFSSAPRMEYEKEGSVDYESDDRGTDAHRKRRSRRNMDRDDDASSAREDNHGRDDRSTYTDDSPYPPPRHHHHHHRHRSRSSSSSSRSSSNITFDPLTATLGTVLGLGLLGSIFSPLTAVYPVTTSRYTLFPGENLYIY